MRAMAELQPALLGKAPCQADFIRLQAPGARFQAFHRWLEESSEALRASQAVLPAALRFVFVAADGSGALAGVMAPSRDQVGREFPLAILLPLDPALLRRSFAAVPLAVAPFFAAANRLLEASERLDAAGLEAGLAALTFAEPSSRLAEASSELASCLRAATVGDLRQPFAQDGHWYALRTFLLACDPERRGAPVRGGTVSLECPLSAKLHPSLWLELAARRARWRVALSFLWSEDKLLLSLGATPASALAWFCKPAASAVKLWPLHTTSAAAIAAARSALSELHDLERGEATLESVWAALEEMP